MGKGLVTESLIIAIADALREKLGTTQKFTLADMPTAIGDIIGGDAELGLGVFGKNGTCRARDKGLDGYNTIVVDVPPDIKVTMTNSATIICGTVDSACTEVYALVGYGGVMILSEEVT